MATLADLEKVLEQIKAGTIRPVVLIAEPGLPAGEQAYDRLLDALVPEDLRSFNLEQLDGARVGGGSDGCL